MSPSPPAVDDEPSPPAVVRHALVHENLLVGGVAPGRLLDRYHLGWRWRPGTPGGPTADSQYGAHGAFLLSPAAVLVGPLVEVAPVAPVRLRAAYLFAQYFGVLRNPQSFTSPHADYSPQRLTEGARAHEVYPARGGRVEASLRLQIAVPRARSWQIVVRNETTFYYQHFGLRGDDDVFYDIAIDALVPGRGASSTDDFEVLYTRDFRRGARLFAGIRGTLTKAFFSDSVYEPGEERRDPNGPMLRVGPVLAHRFFRRPGRRVDEPLAFVLAQWHVLHLWRTGHVDVPDGMGGTIRRGVTAAVPTVLWGLTFVGDLVGR